jgi:hypothetical protein
MWGEKYEKREEMEGIEERERKRELRSGLSLVLISRLEARDSLIAGFSY